MIYRLINVEGLQKKNIEDFIRKCGFFGPNGILNMDSEFELVIDGVQFVKKVEHASKSLGSEFEREVLCKRLAGCKYADINEGDSTFIKRQAYLSAVRVFRADDSFVSKYLWYLYTEKEVGMQHELIIKNLFSAESMRTWSEVAEKLAGINILQITDLEKTSLDMLIDNAQYASTKYTLGVDEIDFVVRLAKAFDITIS